MLAAIVALTFLATPPTRPAEAIVILRCVPDYEARKVRDCVVESENPPGKGFGEAALKQAAKVKLPGGAKTSADGDSAVVRIPMRFTLAN